MCRCAYWSDTVFMETPRTVLEKHIVLTDFDCDLNRRVTPGSLLRHVQQIGTDHCDSWGVTAARYDATGTAFLLAKLSLHITGSAFIGDSLRLVTRPSAPRRAIFFRFTEFFDAQGQSVASVDARWVLVDRETRRILRQPPEGLGFPAMPETVPTHNFSIKRAADMRPAGTAAATFCRCDINSHLNNTVYADIVCDALPPEQMRSRPLAALTLAYHHELRFGEAMELSLGELEGGGFAVAGRRSGEAIFEANAFFAE